jgi:glycosyltransferase involved in cell wall biosynthesis
MKALFIHFYDFSPHSGISKKIYAQVSALRECGLDTELCHIRIEEDGTQKRMIGEHEISNFGKGTVASVVKWFRFAPITKYVLKNNIGFVYLRSFYNTNPQLLKMLRRLKKEGVKCVMEIPTYPYDSETKESSLKHRIIFFINRLYRNKLSRYLDHIITFSEYNEIHGVPTIRISNGIDFSAILLKTGDRRESGVLRLTGVAEVRYWHGFDRVIRGLADYYAVKDNVSAGVKISFNVVGLGSPSDMEALKILTSELSMNEYVRFLGTRSGEELDTIFNNTDFGIASLGRHRSGITHIKTLKNREYAARGIPFIYSECDEDFDTMPYICKAPADDSAINIGKILEFMQNFTMSPAEIRASVEGRLSWRVQMEKIINTINLK